MVNDPLHTQLCDMLGIEFPVVAFTHCNDVAAAVINAGGFAVIGQGRYTPDEIAANIKWMRDRVGSKPFGIDLLLPASAPPSGTLEGLLAQIPEEHRQFVQGIKERYNIPEPKNVPLHHRLQWLSQEGSRRQLEAVLEERVPVFASGLGSPAFVVEAAHARGMQVWGLVGKPRQAQREIDAGVDVIIAAGYDAGGHSSSIGTFSMVPAVVGVAGDTPVLAAGGVTTGRHLAAALCLGAAGVWTGSVWLTSRESDADMLEKEMLIAATAEDTLQSRSYSGFTQRNLRSQWHVEWDTPEAPKPLPWPYQMVLSGPIFQAAADYGIEQFKMVAVGQGVGFMSSMKPARQIVFDMVDEARSIIEGLSSDSPMGAG
jgi:NAD(P)H-dependent flavin oxidoreductase YrpB (nitropropane dioxygenase family)